MTTRRLFRPHGLDQLRDEVDRVFHNFFGDANRAPLNLFAGGGYPAINIWEAENALHAECELPGLKQEEVEILVVGNELTIRGERKAAEASEATFHRRERGTGRFCRVVRLPAEIDADRVEATLRNGVLELTLPKHAAAMPRRIQVTGGATGATHPANN